jgi:hypothetical protein
MVHCAGSRRGPTSRQRSDIDTGAPLTGRAENGAAIVEPFREFFTRGGVKATSSMFNW